MSIALNGFKYKKILTHINNIYMYQENTPLSSPYLSLHIGKFIYIGDI